MRLLAFDTSTEILSVAIACDGQVLEVKQEGGAKSSQTLLPSIERLLQDAGLSLSQLDAIVYGCGPGAFTGLRTTCAVAQGLAWGSGVKAVPVESLMAVAEQARFETGATEVLAVLDARMHEVYTASYRLEPNQPVAAGSALAADAPFWHRLEDIVLLAPETVQTPAGVCLAGNAKTAYPDATALAQMLVAQPLAPAMLRLAPALIAHGLVQAAADIAPVYIRNKVAQTTAERALARQAKA